jgi:hypothetical protein
VIVALASSTCQPGSPAPETGTPSARIGTYSARFVFPPDSTRLYTWDVPGPGKSPGNPDYMWEVSWEPPEERFGVDPDGLALVIPWNTGGPRTGSLADLMAGHQMYLTTYCTACSYSESIVTQDAAVTAALEGTQIVLYVRGRSAVRRIFRHRPDSVILSRRPADQPETEWTVRVAH